MALITLLTDFGNRDEYAGVMKGVIAAIHPESRIVDITHEIDPQDVVHGAYILAAAYTYFPADSIHVAVVDPGVGGKRRILAVEAGGHRFLAPDNGLLERVLNGYTDTTVVSVENERYFLDPVSRTFHGRDIFAPVAAHLACGVPMTDLGPMAERRSIVSGVVPCCRSVSPRRIEGTVVAIDRFGNLMTNIDGVALGQLTARFPGAVLAVDVSGNAIGGVVTAYHQVDDRKPFGILGSRGLLEISVNRGSARQVLGAGKRDRVGVSVI